MCNNSNSYSRKDKRVNQKVSLTAQRCSLTDDDVSIRGADN
jgi:hypothetical protein